MKELWGNIAKVHVVDQYGKRTLANVDFANRELPFYFKKYAELSGKDAILFSNLCLDDQIENMNIKKREDYEETIYHQFTYAFEDRPGVLKTITEMSTSIQLALMQVAEKEPSFQYERNLDGDRTMHYFYYYKGSEGKIIFEFDGSELSLVHEEKRVKVNAENLTDELYKLLNQIQKKARLHNLYNPPRKIFNGYIRRAFQAETGTLDQIFHILSERHGPLEVDEKVARQMKRESEMPLIKLNVDDHRINLIKLIDVYFLLDENKIIISTLDENEAKKVLFDWSQHIVKETMETKFHQ